MKEALLSLVVLTAFASGKSSEIGKDGFNFYKDYLRARSDEVMLEGPSSGERMLYFYRTPLQLYPGLLPAIEQEYRKRTGNAFKNHMLSKDTLSPSDIPAKRSSKTALSMMLQGKQAPFYPTDYQQGDIVEIPVASS